MSNFGAIYGKFHWKAGSSLPGGMDLSDVQHSGCEILTGCAKHPDRVYVKTNSSNLADFIVCVRSFLCSRFFGFKSLEKWRNG